ncbi:HDOD domain-containing protein [Massilia glaciei]|uniref:HDOD domain-containing protein n=2 Tax=Massilia glaciei TaxID=1524097 RepID=A0A2U2HES2_9BURK|nr:HDOD domain-containing protein [Massilia glaciei]
MPGFGKAVGAVLGAMRGEVGQEFNMARTVLSDPVLTKKVEKAVLAGMVAQQVAISASATDPEEAVVCSMLHALGRMLVSFYLPESWGALRAHDGAGGDAAALLGLPLVAIGRAAAERWGLPAKLVASMRDIAPGGDGGALAPEDWLAAMATMSAQCADSLWDDRPGADAQLAALAGRYAGMLGVAPDALVGAIGQARSAAATTLSIAPLARPGEQRARALQTSERRADSHRMLMAGMCAMRALPGDASAARRISMALETLWKALGLARATAFQHRGGSYAAKIGFGEGVRELLGQMDFADDYEPNVFHAALTSDRIIYIDNARDPQFTQRLPPWWNSTLAGARSFLILPLCAGGQPVGFLYGDWAAAYAPLPLAQAEFALLNELRGQLVAAFERRYELETAANRV